MDYKAPKYLVVGDFDGWEHSVSVMDTLEEARQYRLKHLKYNPDAQIYKLVEVDEYGL